MLRISLRDGEALIVNGALLRASGRTELTIENRASLLRGKEIMAPEEATTPARRLYLACMLAYIGSDVETHQQAIVDHLRAIMPTLPDDEAKALSVRFAHCVAVGDYYRGLSACRALIAIEDGAANAERTAPEAPIAA